ncbi:hypothetical protein FB567DRAFT_595360 [Paraphoma chrysanthemicola]|uniref:F-box domain-containing protein n=1 Tax=Paraphoma chrysanthemicola TaxID=798071 RepID=A0A8K0VVP5_9PLEO|nr:hypothetical protein FB567DRAFT_595360 [Paraphoma chrysanthemicola]
MASLLTLPLELLVSVSSYLTTPDLGALRLTCKQAEKSLYEWFAGEFFTKKQFMLTYKSLQAFIDISKHVSFSKKLTHVIIATNSYGNFPLRFRDSEAAERFIEGAEDQNVLLSTGVVCDMLTEAFQNLENLHTVGIRDFNNHQRRRDGVGASWSSWGATTVYRETGIELQLSTNNHLTASQGIHFAHLAFQNILHALGKASRKPQELEVLLRHSLLPDGAFYIPKFLQPALDLVLHDLKTLLLKADVLVRTFHTHTNGTPVDLKPGHYLRCFLGRTPNLTHLRLNLQKSNTKDNEEFLEWLALPSSTPTSLPIPFFDPPPIPLHNLAKLELGQITARPSILLNVISKFAPTLQEISLWRMTMIVGDGTSFAGKLNLWAGFFSKLADVPHLKLTSLKTGMLSQDHFLVQFKDASIEDAEPNKSKEYAGNKMDAFLKELMTEVFVLWPQVVHADTEDEDEDDDEEMQDGDDDGEDQNDDASGDED